MLVLLRLVSFTLCSGRIGREEGGGSEIESGEREGRGVGGGGFRLFNDFLGSGRGGEIDGEGRCNDNCRRSRCGRRFDSRGCSLKDE